MPNSARSDDKAAIAAYIDVARDLARTIANNAACRAIEVEVRSTAGGSQERHIVERYTKVGTKRAEVCFAVHIARLVAIDHDYANMLAVEGGHGARKLRPLQPRKDFRRTPSLDQRLLGLRIAGEDVNSRFSPTPQLRSYSGSAGRGRVNSLCFRGFDHARKQTGVREEVRLTSESKLTLRLSQRAFPS